MTSELALASRGRRVVAALIDFVLVPLVAILIMLVTGVLEHAQDWAENAMPFARMLGLGFASYLLLNGWLLGTRGQTAGKAIMGIAIVSTATSAKAPLWKLVLIRFWFFPALYLVFSPYTAIVPLIDQILIFGKNRRCLHDLLSGSSVVRRTPKGLTSVQS